MYLFRLFRHEKFIFQGADWQNLSIKSQKSHQLALIIALDMSQLIFSGLGQFYEN